MNFTGNILTLAEQNGVAYHRSSPWASIPLGGTVVQLHTDVVTRLLAVSPTRATSACSAITRTRTVTACSTAKRFLDAATPR